MLAGLMVKAHATSLLLLVAVLVCNYLGIVALVDVFLTKTDVIETKRFSVNDRAKVKTSGSLAQ